jgi:hypothetical protein
LGDAIEAPQSASCKVPGACCRAHAVRRKAEPLKATMSKPAKPPSFEEAIDSKPAFIKKSILYYE